jgi:hypothetical protein
MTARNIWRKRGLMICWKNIVNSYLFPFVLVKRMNPKQKEKGKMQKLKPYRLIILSTTPNLSGKNYQRI